MRKMQQRLARVIFIELILAPAFSVIAGEVPTPNRLTESEKKSGWKLLFDGKTTVGWRNYRKDSVSDGWQVIDGALTRAADGAGDLITVGRYGSFEFSLEYKISKGGNSGLMYHVTEEEPNPWQTGPEIQIQDNVDGHDAQKSGWLYQLYPSEIDTTRLAGEWNYLHIRIAPDRCDQFMNGFPYNSYVKGSEDWDRRVAASKFSQLAKFGKSKSGHICLQDHGNLVAFRNIKVRELNADGSVNDPVDSTLSLKAAAAFLNLQWADWSPVDDRGRVQPLRPIVLTHAGDGTNRIFVATQRGVIHVFANKQDASKTNIFLDISKKVIYDDVENEEGLLGVAFHPHYKKNGQFFIYYSTVESPHTSVVSRFRASKHDPNKADPHFEEEIIRFKQPFWNHNGGTLAFGPDGYLYIALGDGGDANDPFNNAQNLKTPLGSILRIDIDRAENGRNYAIPADNPFVDEPEARGEIWAYGLRNVWRMAFDRKTGTLWAGDVGQSLWEEINLIRQGGNYGWNLREARHPFGPRVTRPSDPMIEPIWEYDHEVGKSITGGTVYRGQRLPELVGAYLYADYISGKLFALRYDEKNRKVISNHLISGNKMPVLSFGEDEEGEVYFTIPAVNGQGLFRFVREEK